MKTTIIKISKSVSRFVKSENFIKLAVVAIIIGCVAFDGFAQDSSAGTGAISSVEDEIKKYVPGVKNLLYAIAAVISLVGAFNVYHKMTNGDQDVKKTIMLTLGGCIAMIALSQALPAFFGL